jgi:hypothetical protein
MNSKGAKRNYESDPLQEELMMIIEKKKTFFAGMIPVFFQETSSLRVLMIPLTFGRC